MKIGGQDRYTKVIWTGVVGISEYVVYRVGDILEIRRCEERSGRINRAITSADERAAVFAAALCAVAAENRKLRTRCRKAVAV